MGGDFIIIAGSEARSPVCRPRRLVVLYAKYVLFMGDSL